jgi:hypothetical protein
LREHLGAKPAAELGVRVDEEEQRPTAQRPPKPKGWA